MQHEGGKRKKKGHSFVQGFNKTHTNPFAYFNVTEPGLFQ